jgi:hypothetical protein
MPARLGASRLCPPSGPHPVLPAVRLQKPASPARGRLRGQSPAATLAALPQDPAAATRRHALTEAVHPLAVAPLGLIGTFDGSDLLRAYFLYPSPRLTARSRGEGRSIAEEFKLPDVAVMKPAINDGLRPHHPFVNLAGRKRTTGIYFDTPVQQNSQFTTLYLPQSRPIQDSLQSVS